MDTHPATSLLIQLSLLLSLSLFFFAFSFQPAFAETPKTITTVWGPKVLANRPGLSAVLNPRVGSDGKLEAWATWQSLGGGFPQFFAQRIDVDGRPVFPTQGISWTDRSGIQEDARITLGVSQDAYAAVRIREERKIGLWVQHLSDRGRAMFGKSGRQVSSPEAQASDFALSASPKGVYVTWSEMADSKFRMYSELISSEATPRDAGPILLCDETGEQKDINLLSDGQDGLYVIWIDTRNTGSGLDVYAQHLDSTGKPTWKTNGLALCQAPSDQRDVQAFSWEGDLFVFWNDYRNGNSDIYGTRVGPDGKNLWEADGVPLLVAPGRQKLARVVRGGEKMIWIFVESTASTPPRLFYQQVDFMGRPLLEWTGKEIEPVTGAKFTGIELLDTLASDTEPPLICWRSQRSPEIIYFERPGPGGMRLDTKLPKVDRVFLVPTERPLVITQEEEGHLARLIIRPVPSRHFESEEPRIIAESLGQVPQRTPRLAKLSSGDFLLAWQDHRSGSPELYVQRFSSSGGPRDQADTLVASLEVNAAPRIIPDSSGGAYILVGSNLHHLNAEGRLTTPPGGIRYTLSADNVPDVAAVRLKDDIILVWSSYPSSATRETDIFAQRIDSEGTLLWGAHPPVAVCEATGNQGNPTALVTPDGNIIVAWEDDRLGTDTTDIYAQKISANGKLLWKKALGVPVSTVPGIQRDVHMVDLASLGTLIVWLDESGAAPEIYADLLDAEGESQWNKDGTLLAPLSKGKASILAALRISSNIYILIQHSQGGNMVYTLEKDFQKPTPRKQGLTLLPNGKSAAPAIIVLRPGSEGEGVASFLGARMNLIDSTGNVLLGPTGTTWIKTKEVPENIQAIAVSKDTVVLAWQALHQGDLGIYGASIQIP